MKLKDIITDPIGALTTFGSTMTALFHVDALVVLAQWGWGSLGQLFYMLTLLVSSAPVLPISQSTAAKLVGAAGVLLLLKLGLKAHEQVNNRLEATDNA
jgi:hypothetical protein